MISRSGFQNRLYMFFYRGSTYKGTFEIFKGGLKTASIEHLCLLRQFDSLLRQFWAFQNRLYMQFFFSVRSPTSPRFSCVLHFISHEFPSFLKISFENELDSINTQGCFSFGGLKQLPKLPSGLASPKCLFSVFVYHFRVLDIQQKVGPECVFFFCFRTPIPRLEHSTKS